MPTIIVELVLIPGGTTAVLQPLDVAINRPFKDSLRKLYLSWMVENTSNIETAATKSGYLKPPSLVEVVEWLKTSQKYIKSQHIESAFQATGLTNDYNRKRLFEKLDINFDDLMQRFFSKIILFLYIYTIDSCQKMKKKITI